MTNYPVFKENEKSGKYRVITWPTFGGADAVVQLNQTYKADPDIGKLMATKEFRVALSHAINRDQIKESVFLGLGEARQGVPAPWHPYFPGDESRRSTRSTSRTRPTSSSTASASPRRTATASGCCRTASASSSSSRVVPGLRRLARRRPAHREGLGEGRRQDRRPDPRARAPLQACATTTSSMTEMWNEDTTAFPFTGNAKFDRATHPILTLGPLYGRWSQTKGKEGVEPPAAVKRIMEIVDQARTVAPSSRPSSPRSCSASGRTTSGRSARSA